MTGICPQYEGVVEENVLSFLWRYPVTLPVLYSVCFVPIETNAKRKRVGLTHMMYISHIYAPVKNTPLTSYLRELGGGGPCKETALV